MTGWRVRREDLRAVAQRTLNTAPGLDGLQYVLWRGAAWLFDAVEVLLNMGCDSGGGDAATFGASCIAMIPKGGTARVGDSVFGPTCGCDAVIGACLSPRSTALQRDAMDVPKSLDAFGFGLRIPRLEGYMLSNLVGAAATERAALREGARWGG